LELVRNPFSHRLVALTRGRGIRTILDIGANQGQYARGLRAAGYRDTIVSVEPLSEAFHVLAKHASTDPRWHCVHAAASDRTGTLTVNVSGNSVSSSVLPMLASHQDAAPQSAYIGTEEVRAVVVDDLVVDRALDPEETMLKIDVQGFESAVLDGASRHLGRLAAVQMELSLIPLYGGQQLMPAFVDRMARQGFDLWLLEPGFTEPGSGRLLQCDGVFVKT